MANSRDTRKHLSHQRGSKRYGNVGGHSPPQDDLENTRDHERIWFELRRHRSCCCEPDQVGFRYCVPDRADYPTLVCEEFLLPAGSLIDFWPGSGTNDDGSGFAVWILTAGCGSTQESLSEPFDSATFFEDGSWRNGPFFTGFGRRAHFLSTGNGWGSTGGWPWQIAWSYEYWLKPSQTDIDLERALTGADGLAGDKPLTTQMGVGGKIGFTHADVNEGATVWSATGLLTADEWHHIVYVRDLEGPGFSIYVNGVRRVYRVVPTTASYSGSYFAFVDGNGGGSNSQFADLARYGVAVPPRVIWDHYRVLAEQFSLTPPDGEAPDGGDGGGGTIENPADFIFDLQPDRIDGEGFSGYILTSGGETGFWQSPEDSPFELEARKGVADGYAELDSGILVPAARMGTGTPGADTFLSGERVWEPGQLLPVPSAVGQMVRADPSSSDEYFSWVVENWTSFYHHWKLVDASAPFANERPGSSYATLGALGTAPDVVTDDDYVFGSETVVEFDGTDGLQSDNPSSPTSRQAFGFWIKLLSYPVSEVNVVTRGVDELKLGLQSDGKLRVSADGVTELTSVSVLPLDEWVHVLLGYDDAGVSTGSKLWLNGVADATGASSTFQNFWPITVGSDGLNARMAHITLLDGYEWSGNLLDADVAEWYATRRPVWTLIDEISGGSGGIDASEDDTPVTLAPRSRVNFKAGANVSLGVVDDEAGDEIEVTIGASPPAGAGIEVSDNDVDVSVSPRGRLNFKDGLGTTAVVTDDGVNDEVEVKFDLPSTSGRSDGDVLALDASLLPTWEAPSGGGGGGGLFNAYAYLRNEQPANTQGGLATVGSFGTCVLNTEVFDPDGIVSLAANQFTLQAGTYLIVARQPHYQTGRFRLRIRNVTDGLDVGYGFSSWATNAGNDGTIAKVLARVTIASAKVFELQHRAGTGDADGRALGVEANFGVNEIYGEVEIWREA